MNAMESTKPILGHGVRADYSPANQAWIIRPYSARWNAKVQANAPVLRTLRSRAEADAYVNRNVGASENPNMKNNCTSCENPMFRPMMIGQTMRFSSGRLGTVVDTSVRKGVPSVKVRYDDGTSDWWEQDDLLQHVGVRRGGSATMENPMSDGQKVLAVAAVGALALGAAAGIYMLLQSAKPATAPATIPPTPTPTPGPPTPVPPGAKNVVLVPEDTGKVMIVNVGDVVTIRMPQVSGTGYDWNFTQITANPAAPPLEQEETPEEGAVVRYEGGTGPGSVQTAVVKYIAKRPGSSKIRGQMQRGGQGTPTSVFEVAVTVMAQGIYV